MDEADTYYLEMKELPISSYMSSKFLYDKILFKWSNVNESKFIIRDDFIFRWHK